jgi:hypothetical protein
MAPARMFFGPENDRVPEFTVTVPVSRKDTEITLAPVPPVFSNRPVLLMNEPVAVPRAMPLLSAIAQVAVFEL